MSLQCSNQSTIKEKPTQLSVYKNYVAVKTHFTNDKYDYFKSRGKTNAGFKSLERRADKNFFAKLAKQKDYFKILLSNIAYSDSWIGDIVFNEESLKNYKEFCRRNQSLTYIIQQQLKLLKPNLKENFIIENNHPYIFQLFVEGSIYLETISILAKITGAGQYWDKYLKADPLWQMYRIKVLKYERFLSYDKEKIRQLMKSRV